MEQALVVQLQLGSEWTATQMGKHMHLDGKKQKQLQQKTTNSKNVQPYITLVATIQGCAN